MSRVFKFKNRPIKTVEINEWSFKFYLNENSVERSYLDISSTSKLFGMRIGGNSHAFGYLLAAAEQGLDEQLHGYVTMLCVPALAITADQELCDGLTREITEYLKRLDKQAQGVAENISDEEDQANQALMTDVAEYADAKPKERKKKRKAHKKAVKEEVEKLISEE